MLALTAKEADVKQIGAYYSAVPYPTAQWTQGEFGLVFLGRVDTTERIERMLSLMSLTNATHLVVSNRDLADFLERSGRMEVMRRFERFAVLRRPEALTSWSDPPDPLGVHTERVSDDRFEILATSRPPQGNITIKSAYHPFWKLEAPDGLTLGATGAGLLLIQGVEEVPARMSLHFRAPRTPIALSLAGIVALIALAWRRRP